MKNATKEEQALIIKIRLLGGAMGSNKERANIQSLEDGLQQVIKAATAGELDGDEFGDHVCTIYLYGPDADRLFEAAIPTLRQFDAPSGSSLIKRYGTPGARQESVSLVCH